MFVLFSLFYSKPVKLVYCTYLYYVTSNQECPSILAARWAQNTPYKKVCKQINSTTFFPIVKFFICKKFGKYSISRIFQLFCFYYFTFTIITFFFPSLVFTVILHLPFFNALITPFFVTLAILLLEERYIILAIEDAGIFLL